jgi:hypothetical protein
MWNWFNCYLSGRHQYGMWCEPGTIFLRCVHCGRRSAGWDVDAPKAVPARVEAIAPKARLHPTDGSRVVPFRRRIAS